MINLAIRLSLAKPCIYLLGAVLFIRALSYFPVKQTYHIFTNYFVKAMFLIFILEFIMQSLAQITPLFYYRIINIQFCNITLYSSTLYDILGEIFKLKL